MLISKSYIAQVSTSRSKFLLFLKFLVILVPPFFPMESWNTYKSTIISKSYIAHVSTKQGAQGAEYIQAYCSYCSDKV